MMKRELSKDVSNSTVDRVYETAVANGSLGGKLLGAGGTGFMLFFVPLEKREAVRQSLSPFIHVPFRFEREGSSLIYYGTNDTEFSPAGRTDDFEKDMPAPDKLHELAIPASF
jgi:D-glycero-alpha-D-manno-heptose-7-phosphate kinase